MAYCLLISFLMAFPILAFYIQLCDYPLALYFLGSILSKLLRPRLLLLMKCLIIWSRRCVANHRKSILTIYLTRGIFGRSS